MTNYIINSTGGTGVNAHVFKDNDNSEWIVFGVGLDSNVQKQADRYGYGDNLKEFTDLVTSMAENVASDLNMELTDKTVFLEENSSFVVDKEVDIPDPNFLQALSGNTSHLLKKV